jgi:phosphoglycolate phosphatase
MRKVDLIVFDLDGTLVNTGDDLTSSVNHTLSVLNVPLLKKETVLRFVGDGVGKLIERSLGNGNHHRFDEALGIFSDYYSEHMLDKTDLYPGVRDVLDYFKDIKKCIVTNKLDSFAVKISRALGIDGYFDDIIGMGSTPYIKPDPYLVTLLLEKYDIKNEGAVVVGDGKNDMMMAKKSGVSSCAFLNGLSEREKLLRYEPDYTCESIAELKDIFS